MMRHPIALLVAFALIACSSLTSRVSAETVIKFDLAGTPGPDVGFSSDVLGTIPDGVASPGEKLTDVAYFGFLGGLGSVEDASLTLAGVMKSGNATVTDGEVRQGTDGGTFSLYAKGGLLLLAGQLGTGVINGDTTAPTGSFRSKSAVTFTDGSLLSFLQPNSGAISLSFNNVLTNGNPGMVVSGTSLLNFTATANGAIDASAVPEPSVLGMAAIGAIALVRHRRHRKSKSKAA